jgi:hypothetical protein
MESKDLEGFVRNEPPSFEEERKDRAERGSSSGGTCATPQEVENEHDQADDQQDVDKASANVKCEKAKQPENNQHQGDKSEHSFVSSSRGKEFRESCASSSCDGQGPKVITQGDFRRARKGNLCSLRQFRCGERSAWDFLDGHQAGRGLRRRLGNARF